jgi:hypothetical protein
MQPPDAGKIVRQLDLVAAMDEVYAERASSANPNADLC